MLIRGKNVCIYYLAGTCKFGDDKCSYAHTKACLLKDSPWHNRLYAQNEIRKVAVDMKILRNVEREQARDYGGGFGLFSAEDEYELMCQGVKPWDDDAAVSTLYLWREFWSWILLTWCNSRTYSRCSTATETRYLAKYGLSQYSWQFA